jgi:hypothetical protein
MNELDNLIAAATEGNAERVSAILNADSNLVNERDSSGATAAHYAALNANREVVRLLVQRGADIKARTVSMALRPRVGPSSISASLAGIWRSSLTILHTPFGSKTCDGLYDS